MYWWLAAGREHALVWKLKQSPGEENYAPGNAGIRLAGCVNIDALDLPDWRHLPKMT